MEWLFFTNKPVELKLYIGLSYDVLAPQWTKLYGEAENYKAIQDNWYVWEQLWDLVLTHISLALNEQYCQIISRENIDPDTLLKRVSSSMTEDLNEVWHLRVFPPSIDFYYIPKALQMLGFTDGICYLKYTNSYGQLIKLNVS